MMNFKHVLQISCFLLLSQAAFAQTAVFANSDNIALNGYDVVAYHNAYDAIRGNGQYQTTYKGTVYHFQNAENLKAFMNEPSKYLPEFGGYCAFAVGMGGGKVSANPETFKIRDGKLYFFYNDFYEGQVFNTIVPWNANEAEMIEKANTMWEAIGDK